MLWLEGIDCNYDLILEPELLSKFLGLASAVLGETVWVC